ncbi:MAG: XRE family transcriptional regulator, partial [Erysipelotrichia bacterium]|nr:XRE family transcriptional regulator [Erysipelotrichia bacterium]
NDLTLEELASRCELTKGFLSQLENNLATPSLTTLMDIVEALGISMSTFFSEEKEEKIVFDKNDYFVDEKEGYTINWIVPDALKNQMQPMIIELKPYSRSETVLPQQAEEFGYILTGSVTLVYGKRKINLKSGNTFYFPSKKEHYLENNTGKTAKIMWISNPPIF